MILDVIHSERRRIFEGVCGGQCQRGGENSIWSCLGNLFFLIFFFKLNLYLAQLWPNLFILFWTGKGQSLCKFFLPLVSTLGRVRTDKTKQKKTEQRGEKLKLIPFFSPINQEAQLNLGLDVCFYCIQLLLMRIVVDLINYFIRMHHAM